MSVRIHKLAEELGLDNKQMMALLKERRIIGQDVKTVSSYVDDSNAAALREEFKRKQTKKSNVIVAPHHGSVAGKGLGKAESRRLNTQRNDDREEISIWIDPGDAPQEDIAELFAALSDLNRAEGGPGLLFARDRKGHPFVLAPA